MTPNEVLSKVARATQTPEAFIRGNRRFREVVAVRQLYCLICKRNTGASLKLIGDTIGRRDHTTILYSIQVASDLIRLGDKVMMLPLRQVMAMYPELVSGIVAVVPLKPLGEGERLGIRY